MKTGTRLWQTLLGLCLCLWLAGACVPRRPAPRTPEPTPVPRSEEFAPSQARVQAPSGQWVLDKYTDLPIPKGFELNAEDSFVFMQGALRSVDLKYVGYRSEQKLIQFYQESMPTHGWHFLRMTGVKMKTLTYVKGAELCEIIIMVYKPRRGQGQEESRPLTYLYIKMNPY